MTERDYGDGHLLVKPAAPTKTVDPGFYELELGTAERDGILYIPDTDERELPLLVALHGATMHARQMLRPLVAAADDAGIALLVPDSRGQTWDVILGGYGPDLVFLDAALSHTFDHCAIDATRIGIGGVSDGASYALSVGAANGNLFTKIIALSPGFIAPLSIEGQPDVFISHGVHDRILPIDTCGRPIAQGLKGAGYAVEYVEFDGGHEMPDPIIRKAFEWFVQ